MNRKIAFLTVFIILSLVLFTSRQEAQASFSSSPVIALTFDDGPHPVYTDEILDVLRDNGARATFFVMGQKISSCLSQTERILGDGHQLGNHTFDHRDLTRETAEGIRNQAFSVYREALRYFGEGPLVLRPPYGFINDTVRKNAGFPLILWSVDTLDWKSRDAADVCARVLSRVRDGDIILMHDIYPSTAEAVRMLLPQLRELGFRMVTVSELFCEKGVQLTPGGVYYSGLVYSQKIN